MELENEKLQKAQVAEAKAAATLAAQQKLFDSELPKWERIIASLSHNLIRTRAIDLGLVEAQDVANKLRLKIWDAISKYDPSKEAALNTWITRLLRQECVLIMQAHYNKVNRGRRRILFSIEKERRMDCVREELNDSVIPECIWQGFKDTEQSLADEASVIVKKVDLVWSIVDSAEIYPVKQLQKVINIYQEGKVLLHVPLANSSLEEFDEGSVDPPDFEAEAAFDNIFAVPWFRRNTDIIFQALQNKEPGGLNEKKVFAMILSGRYGTDREIADHLDINFAKVGEVRFKAKIVFALVEGIPISTFSKAQNALTLARRLRTLLKPYVGELPTVVP